jgi:hypothetical protein
MNQTQISELPNPCNDLSSVLENVLTPPTLLEMAISRQIPRLEQLATMRVLLPT